MAKPHLEHLDVDRATEVLDQLVAVYVEVYAHTGDDFFGEDRYRRQLDGHMRAPNWEMVTASIGGELVGYIYGFALAPTTRWWNGLITEMPDGFTIETGQRTLAISELLVREPWRNEGIGRALHDELLARRIEERATLLVEPDNTVARRSYVRWGWEKVAELRPSWEGAPLYQVFIKSV